MITPVAYFYPVLHKNKKEPDVNDESDDDTVGGIFRLKSKSDSQSTGTMHERDCSLEVISTPLRDWNQPTVLESIRDCFVTGKWKDSEDAEILLQDDDQSMNCSSNNLSGLYISVPTYICVGGRGASWLVAWVKQSSPGLEALCCVLGQDT